MHDADDNAPIGQAPDVARADLSRFVDAKDWDSAQAVLDRMSDAWTDKPWFRQAALSIAQARGEYDVALEHLESLLAANPDRVLLLRRRATILLDAGQAERALAEVATLAANGAATAPLLVRGATCLADGKTNPETAQAWLQAAIDLDPGFVPAYQSCATLSQSLGKPDQAISWIKRGLEHRPSHPGLRNRLIGALLGVGQLDEARAHLTAFLTDTPDDPVLNRHQAQILRRDGDAAGADACLGRVLRAEPDNMGAHLARIDLWLTHGVDDRAQAALQAAQAVFPNEPSLVLRQVRLQRRNQAPEQVIELIDALDGDIAPALRLERCIALRQAERFDDALSELDALESNAEMRQQVAMQRTTTLLAAGQADEALRCARTLNDERPDLPGPWRELARAQAATGQYAAALETLAQATSTLGEDIEMSCDQAGLLLQMERLADAREVLQAVMSRHPGHERALVLLADSFARDGNLQDAVACLERALEGWLGGEMPDDANLPVALAVRYVSYGWKITDPARTRKAVALLVAALPRMSEPDCLRFLAAVSWQEDSKTETEIVAALLNRPRLGAPAVIGMVRHLLRRIGTQRTKDVAKQLLLRVPRQNLLVAQLSVTALLDGPALALAGYRNELPKTPRRPQEAALIGQMLREMGKSPISARYLSRAARRWPRDSRIVSELTESLAKSGQIQNALDRLAHFASQHPGFMKRQARLLGARFLFYLGRLDDSLDLLESIPGLHANERSAKLQMLLWKGELDKAEPAARDFLDDNSCSTRQKAHFSTSLEGTVLAELRLMDMLEKTGQTIDAFQFLAPCRAVVQHWISHDQPPLARPAEPAHRIPATIMQYWDDPAPPPGVVEVIQSWQSAERYQHVLFDRRSAAAYLAQTFDVSWAKAFRNARHASEKADFFRLAYLYASGGVYADADDRRVGDIMPLFAGGEGAILYAEPLGSLGSNFIAAAPEHPLIRLAAEQARDALLSRDSSNIWTKTGPGLLTRAAARYIAECRDKGASTDVRIFKAHQVAPFVQFFVKLPFQDTTAHWRSGQSDRSQQRILDAIAGSAGLDVA